jgi:hypothetical protein
MAANASRPYAYTVLRQQVPAPQDEAMDPIREVVQDIRSYLHDMDRSQAHNRHIRPIYCRRADGEAEHKVLVTTTHGGYGRDTVG